MNNRNGTDGIWKSFHRLLAHIKSSRDIIFKSILTLAHKMSRNHQCSVFSQNNKSSKLRSMANFIFLFLDNMHKLYYKKQ